MFCKRSCFAVLLGCLPLMTAPCVAQWTTSGNNIYNSNSGNVGIGTSNPVSETDIVSSSSTTKTLVVQGAASQSADLQEWQNSSGTVLSSVSSAGHIGIGEAPVSLLDIQTTKYLDTSSFEMHTSDGAWAMSTTTGSLRLNPAASSGLGELTYLNSTGTRFSSLNNVGSTWALLEIDGSPLALNALSGQKVGIGISNPVQTLDVRAAQGTDYGIYTGYGAQYTSGSSGITLLGTNDQGYPLALFTSPSSAFGSAIGSYDSTHATEYPLTISSSTLFVGPTRVSNPTGTMEVYDATASSGATQLLVQGGASAGDAGTHQLFRVNQGGGTAGLFVVQGNGNVGIDTTTPGQKLEINGSIKLTSGSGGTVVFADGTTQSTAWTGAVCGGDYAESVNVSGDRTHYEPGDVLVIDPANPGKFLKSAQPYSTTVAGIYSTKPGVVGKRFNNPDNPATQIPMAMVGIVPTKVSAENGSIKVGDLLVTSSTRGYAMKGTDRSQMLGAIVGKALGSLDSGTGVIDVVVSLQ